MQLKRISKEIAFSFYMKYEHLGNCGLGVWHYGLYDSEMLLSVVSFGTVNFNPQRSKVSRTANQFNLRIIQLTRGGTRFDAPKSTPSKTIALALKEIKKDIGPVLIIAYSDTGWNEIGTIYQASNFMYLGMTNPKGQANYYIDGKFMSGWSVRKRFGTRDLKILQNVVGSVSRIQLTPKHMYLFVNANRRLKKKVISDIQPICQAYPKRKELNIESMLSIRLLKNQV